MTSSNHLECLKLPNIDSLWIFSQDKKKGKTSSNHLECLKLPNIDSLWWKYKKNNIYTYISHICFPKRGMMTRNFLTMLLLHSLVRMERKKIEITLLGIVSHRETIIMIFCFFSIIDDDDDNVATRYKKGKCTTTFNLQQQHFNQLNSNLIYILDKIM